MINYGIIHAATDFYAKHGFQRVEVPWTVTKEISDITKPPEKRDFQLVHENGKVLVGSAEQSFLYQYAKGFLPLSKYLAITPCFRFESITSPDHSKYFIKAELIQTDAVSFNDLRAVIDVAFQFFSQYLPPNEGLAIKQTDLNQFDIEFRGKELGSYGIRSCDFLTWIFATGVAEPRLSQTLYLFNRK